MRTSPIAATPKPPSRRKGRLTEGPVERHLARIAAPTAWGVLMVMSIGLADTYYLARFGHIELAAISYVLPIQLVLTSAAMGLAVATNAVVSPPLGKGHQPHAHIRASAALLLTLVVSLVIVGLGLISARPLFSMMGAKGETLDLIVSYMRIWYPSFVLLALAMVGNAVIRATGDAMRPATVMTVAAVSNIAIAPVFIFGFSLIPELGMTGAAIATFVSRIVMFLVLAAFLFRTVIFRAPRKRLTVAIWQRLLLFGLPVAGTNVINPIGIAAITAALAFVGDQAVSAFGIASRIQLIAVVPFMALATAIGPVVGQNFGAGLKPRVSRALCVVIGIVIAYGFVLAAILFFGGGWLGALFTDHPAIAASVSLYMRILPASLIAYGIMLVMTAALNAIGRPVPGLIAAILRIGVVTIPGAFLAAAFGNIWLVFAVMAGGNIVGFAITLIAVRRAHLLRQE